MLFVVHSKRLPDFVREVRNGKGLSLKAVERAARGGVTASYVSLIENDRVPNPGHNKLVALAHGLGVPEEELLAAARGRVLSEPDARELQLLTMFRELPAERQGDAVALIRTLHKRHGAKPVEQKFAAEKSEKRRRAA